MARGVLLVLAAVVLGVVLLRSVDDSPELTVGAGETPQETVVPGDTSTTEPTVPLAHDPADVTVLVANGSGVKGAARRLSEVLQASNFVTATPADTKSPVSSSAVYYVPGYEADARAVAALLKPSPPALPMPSVQPVADLANAEVLVVVAADLAAPASSGAGRTTTTSGNTTSTIGSAPTSSPD